MTDVIDLTLSDDEGGDSDASTRRRQEQHGRQIQQQHQQRPPQLPLPVSEYRAFLQNTPSNQTTYGRVFTSFLPGSMPLAVTARAANSPTAQNNLSVSAAEHKASVQAHGAVASTHSAAKAPAHPRFAMVVANALGLTRTTTAVVASASTAADTQQQKRLHIMAHHRPSPSERVPLSPCTSASYFGRPARPPGQSVRPDHIHYNQPNQHQQHQQHQAQQHLPVYQHQSPQIQNQNQNHDYHHNQNGNQNHNRRQPPRPSFHDAYTAPHPPSPHQSRLPPLYSLSSQQSPGPQSNSPTEVQPTSPFRFAPTAEHASFAHASPTWNRQSPFPQPPPQKLLAEQSGPSSAHMSSVLVSSSASSAPSASSASASVSVLDSASTPASFFRTRNHSHTDAGGQRRTEEPSSSAHLWTSLPTRQLPFFVHDSLSPPGLRLPQPAFKRQSTPPHPHSQSQPRQSRSTPTHLTTSRLPLLDHPSPSGQLLASQLSAMVTAQPLEPPQPPQPLQSLQQTARFRRRSLSSVPSPSSQLSSAVAASPHTHTHTAAATPLILARAPLVTAPSVLGSAPKSPSSSSLSLSSLCSDSPPTPTFSHPAAGMPQPRPVGADDDASVETSKPVATSLEKGPNARSVDLAQPGILERFPGKCPDKVFPEAEDQPELREPERLDHPAHAPEAVTPKAAVAWTTAKIEVALQDLLRALHADHARLVEHTMSSQKPRQQRFLSAIDDFADMPSRNTDTAAEDKDCLKVRIRTHRENQKRAEGRVLHCETTTLRTPNQSVPKYRFHHVEIAKNILSPNTPLKFIPHIRDLEDGSEDKKRFDQWIEELESMELKSGFDSSKRMDKWASTRVTEFSKLVSLYLDAWLAELAIDNCSKATLIRYMASEARDDEAITPKQKSSLLQSCRGDMSMSSASPQAIKAASMFTDAFNRVFRTKSITLKNVLVQDEALGANQLVLASGNANPNTNGNTTVIAIASDHDKENYLDLIQQYLGTYSFLGCLICHAHSCEHGEFDGENVRRGFSIEDLGWKLWMHVARRRDLQAKERRQQQKLQQQQQQQIQQPQQHYPPPLQQQQQLQQLHLSNVFISHSCNNQCYRSYDIGDPAFGNRPWADDETNLLRSLHFVMADSNGKLQCTAASILGRACWEVYRRMKELDIQGPLPLPPRAPDPASVKPASWYDRHRKVLIGDWSDHTYTHAHALREQREPCNHDGPCTVARGCPCVESKLLCERFCRCTSDTCAYKFTGCACHSSGKSCYARQKEGRPCICVQLNRECDPVLCRGCGARERADIRNRDDAHLHATGCQNVALQRGLAKSVTLGKSQLEGCGYGLFTAEDIAADDFVIEYVGELITHDEGVRREARRGDVFNQESNASYLFTLLEQDGIWVDAAIYGNLSRYINHASESDKRGCNITPKILYVNGEFRIKFTAMRDIKTGEELFFNYGENFPNLTKKLLEDKASNSDDDDVNSGDGDDGGADGNGSGKYGYGSGDRSKNRNGDANGLDVGIGNSTKTRNGNSSNSNRGRGRTNVGSRAGAARTRRRRRTVTATTSKSKSARKEAPPIQAEVADSIEDVMDIDIDVDADDDDNDNDMPLPLLLRRRTSKRKRLQQEQEDNGKADDADSTTATSSVNGFGPTGSRARMTRQRTNASAVQKKSWSDHHDDGDEESQDNVAADPESLRSAVIHHKAATRHSGTVNNSRNSRHQDAHNGDNGGDYGGEPARKRIRIVRSGQAITLVGTGGAADLDAPSISSLQQEKPQKRIRIVSNETETVAAVTAVVATTAAVGIESDESVIAPLRRRLRRLDQQSTAADDDLVHTQSTPRRERKRSSSRSEIGGPRGQQGDTLSNFHITIDSVTIGPRRIIADSDEVQDDSDDAGDGDGDGDGEDDDDVVDRSSRKRQKPARYRSEGA